MKNIAFVYSGSGQTFHLYNYTEEARLDYKVFGIIPDINHPKGGIDYLVRFGNTAQALTEISLDPGSRIEVYDSKGLNLLTGYV